jgi:hypothetical protein
MMQGPIFDGKIFTKCAKYIAISDAYFEIKYAKNTEVKNTISDNNIFDRDPNVIMLFLVVYFKDFD